MTLLEMKQKFILEILKKNNYNRTKTAKELDISTRAIRNYIREWWPELKKNGSQRNIAKERDEWNSRDKW